MPLLNNLRAARSGTPVRYTWRSWNKQNPGVDPWTQVLEAGCSEHPMPCLHSWEAHGPWRVVSDVLTHPQADDEELEQLMLSAHEVAAFSSRRSLESMVVRVMSHYRWRCMHGAPRSLSAHVPVVRLVSDPFALQSVVVP